MPINPNRKAQGGDVEGVTDTDTGIGVSRPLKVSKASFDPGYDLGSTVDESGVTEAEIKQGYTSYGRKKIGEGK